MKPPVKGKGGEGGGGNYIYKEFETHIKLSPGRQRKSDNRPFGRRGEKRGRVDGYELYKQTMLGGRWQCCGVDLRRV